MDVRAEGRDYSFTRKGVERVLLKVPEKTVRYVVNVRGRLYPVKQAFAVGVGRRTNKGFNTYHARKALETWFDVFDLRDCKRKLRR